MATEEQIIWALVLENAVEHNGIIDPNSVINKAMSPKYKKYIKMEPNELVELIKQIGSQINDYNRKDRERLWDQYKKYISEDKEKRIKTGIPDPFYEKLMALAELEPTDSIASYLSKALCNGKGLFKAESVKLLDTDHLRNTLNSRPGIDEERVKIYDHIYHKDIYFYQKTGIINKLFFIDIIDFTEHYIQLKVKLKPDCEPPQKLEITSSTPNQYYHEFMLDGKYKINNLMGDIQYMSNYMQRTLHHINIRLLIRWFLFILATFHIVENNDIEKPFWYDIIEDNIEQALLWLKYNAMARLEDYESSEDTVRRALRQTDTPIQVYRLYMNDINMVSGAHTVGHKEQYNTLTLPGKEWIKSEVEYAFKDSDATKLPDYETKLPVEGATHSELLWATDPRYEKLEKITEFIHNAYEKETPETIKKIIGKYGPYYIDPRLLVNQDRWFIDRKNAIRQRLSEDAMDPEYDFPIDLVFVKPFNFKELFYFNQTTGKEYKVKVSHIFEILEENKRINVWFNKKVTGAPQLTPKNYIIHISNDPIDIMRKSTGQNWSSCEELGKGYDKGIWSDILHQNAIAILKEEGKDKWVARVMLRRCILTYKLEYTKKMIEAFMEPYEKGYDMHTLDNGDVNKYTITPEIVKKFVYHNHTDIQEDKEKYPTLSEYEVFKHISNRIRNHNLTRECIRNIYFEKKCDEIKENIGKERIAIEPDAYGTGIEDALLNIVPHILADRGVYDWHGCNCRTPYTYGGSSNAVQFGGHLKYYNKNQPDIKHLPYGIKKIESDNMEEYGTESMNNIWKKRWQNSLGSLKDPEEMSKNEIQEEINSLLFDEYTRNKYSGTDPELLTIVIIQDKADYFDFLKAETKWRVKGRWHEYKDENYQIEVQFLDNKDEGIGNRLMHLLNEYNNRFVKEELLYARTTPIEEGTLQYTEFEGVAEKELDRRHWQEYASKSINLESRSHHVWNKIEELDQRYPQYAQEYKTAFEDAVKKSRENPNYFKDIAGDVDAFNYDDKYEIWYCQNPDEMLSRSTGQFWTSCETVQPNRPSACDYVPGGKCEKHWAWYSDIANNNLQIELVPRGYHNNPEPYQMEMRMILRWGKDREGNIKYATELIYPRKYDGGNIPQYEFENYKRHFKEQVDQKLKNNNLYSTGTFTTPYTIDGWVDTGTKVDDRGNPLTKILGNEAPPHMRGRRVPDSYANAKTQYNPPIEKYASIPQTKDKSDLLFIILISAGISLLLSHMMLNIKR